ncbi:MAG TPA: DUF4331 domain-containing protein [Streptosporangiaceae bacterium]|nr:DUF4331 domain-containing protein [Streptosporangiaceae bacterium]
MSSHREAPEISQDPVADSTDLYAFVSPDQPDTVTLIANYIPLQEPSGGPNFYAFGDDVLYEIKIDNDGDGRTDISYQFRFESRFTTPSSFLYNTGPIGSLSDPNWNSKQFYSVTRVDEWGSHVLGHNLACPPCNVGILSTPDYEANLGKPAVHSLSHGTKVFAGQRAEEFYVDLGSIFDLGNLRPLQEANVFGAAAHLKSAPGVNATNRLNVHSIAIQVPISAVTRKGRPTIGVWTTASRQRVRVASHGAADGVSSGPFTQVSRLGNPLINEVIIPLGKKDQWNREHPSGDKEFAKYYANPELAGLLPVLYPGAFPHLAALDKAGTARADLEAILLTGIPSGLIPGFTNFTGSVQADMLRLNTSIPPTPTSSPKYSILGLIGGDAAGFPNGRRVTDDVVTIELRAIAGKVFPLIDPTYVVDGVVDSVTDGLTNTSVTNMPVAAFPYLGVPYDGYHNPS